MRQIAEEVYGKYDVKMVETMEYHSGSFALSLIHIYTRIGDRNGGIGNREGSDFRVDLDL